MTYETLPNIKAVVAPDATLSAAQDALINALLAAVSQAIDNHCNRTFTFIEDDTRTYEAPASATLWVDDMVDDTPTIVVVRASTPTLLTVDDFRLRPKERTALQPHHYAIQRMSGTSGKPVAWARTGEYVELEITADWGYASAVPAVVVEACQIMTCRLYQRSIAHYDNERGSTADGASIVQAPKASLDKDVCQLLEPLRLKWPRTNTPAWSGV